MASIQCSMGTDGDGGPSCQLSLDSLENLVTQTLGRHIGSTVDKMADTLVMLSIIIFNT